MSELLHDKKKRKELLKHMIQQLHAGEAPDAVRTQLVRILGQVPYDEVVEVEQELISEGLPAEEVLKLCDVHTEALKGSIDTSGAREVPAGHPVHSMRQENLALGRELKELDRLYGELDRSDAGAPADETLDAIRGHFNALMDVEKHYLRKENLLFPFLEKHGITGPPTVMWGKHDETRALLKGAFEALDAATGCTVEEAQGVVGLVLRPASAAVEAMIEKEEQILLPMSLDTLTDAEWYEVQQGSDELGYCLVAPSETWSPAGVTPAAPAQGEAGRIQLPTGGFSAAQLEAILNTIPFDVTFVDAEDTVRYFSHGKERIFARSRAILGRKVQFCHPPSSVDTVQRILDDFHAGRQDHAHFWITLGGRFISIEYFAMRDSDGAYLGTLEVSQDLTEKRALEGDRRLLTYDDHKEAAQKPPWLQASGEILTHDARAEIAAGSHPLPQVLAEAQALEPGQALALITPFLPSPLIEKVKALGFSAWTEQKGPAHFISYFARQA